MEQQLDDQMTNEDAMPTDENHLGRVFAVPDKWWGFRAIGREDHPGACVHELPAERDWILLKGTGAENRERIGRTEVAILPDEENGLQKDTVFSLRPWTFRSHRLRNLVPERVMGKLADDDLQTLQKGMLHYFGL